MSNSDDLHQTEEGARVVILPPPLFLCTVVLGWGVNQWVPFGLRGGSIWGLAVGLVLICIGLIPTSCAFSLFMRMGQNPSPRRMTPELTRKGPYRFSRNPMYLGLALVSIGCGLAFDSGWILVLLVPTLVILHYGVILPEERYLEKKFGEEYLGFKRSVRRWI